MDKVNADEKGSDSGSGQPLTGPPWGFTLVVEGGLGQKPAALDKVGCGDATVGSVDGIDYADFLRGGSSFESTLVSTILAVESVDGLVVRRVEPDDLVTAAEIATRLGRSRESVRLLIAGARGSGNFPAPVSHLRSRQRLWRWSEVAAWVGEMDDDQRWRATVLAGVNTALEYRRLEPGVRQLVDPLAGFEVEASRTEPTEVEDEEPEPVAESPKPPAAKRASPSPRSTQRSTKPPSPATRPTTTRPEPVPEAPTSKPAPSEFVAAAGPPRTIQSYWSRAGLEAKPKEPEPADSEASQPEEHADDLSRDRGRRFRRRAH
ncbi:MAG TPA: hypothetical protein VK386_02585 [Acidimicrobiales bacterium]|nr:hypothetical protein [Acidimicrobiales bacterium]